MGAPSPAETVRAAARTIGPNTSTLPGSRVKVSPAMPIAPTARPSASSTGAATDLTSGSSYSSSTA